MEGRAPVPRSRRAFTLLEVLVALAIFALVAVVLGGAYLNILNAYAGVGRGAGDDREVACARQALLAQADLQTAKNGDEYDTAEGRHVKWTADIEPANTTDLFSVTFTCVITSSSPQDQPRRVTQSFMLLRPTWSDPTDSSNLRQNAATRIAKLQGKQA